MINDRTSFPDGSRIDDWFYDINIPDIETLGKQYHFNEYGIFPSDHVQTKSIQSLIDRVAGEDGGVIVVDPGVYISGALNFKNGVNLYLSEGAVLKGSDDICDFPVTFTRIEGQSCDYFPALINADGMDGFVIAGSGVIDGNGLRYWKQFWCRRAWNKDCTNKDEQRPRLVFISNSRNVTVCGVTMRDSAFWTNHLYKCERVRYIDCRITSPHEPVGAPSTDAIDIDACRMVHVKNCYMAVNDDAVALKGGKGPDADSATENGANERVIIEDCDFGFCHGCLTFGSESIHDNNIILRNITVDTGYNMLWLKMRPDTPQCYENVLVENVSGHAANFLNINPWRQFFDAKGKAIPPSLCRNITLKDCTFTCDTYFNVNSDPSQFILKDFTFKNLSVCAADIGFDGSVFDGYKEEDIVLSKKDDVAFPDSITTL